MANQDNYKTDYPKTYVRETRTTETSGSGMALIIGGLVVAVAFILWLVFGGSQPVATTVPAGDTTNVTIEPAAPAQPTTNVTIDPAPEPAAPVAPTDVAPVDEAPADGGTVAPAPTQP